MHNLTFLDFAVKQFPGKMWQAGLSLYRTGSILYFKEHGELISAKLRVGIGENYDVRIKLQNSNNLIQWMECTCKTNRNRSENCQHLSAFCIFLANEQKAYLTKININPGKLEDYYNTQKVQLSKDIKKTEPKLSNVDEVKLQEQKDFFKGLKLILNESNIAEILANNDEQIVSVNLDNELPYIQVTTQIVKLTNKLMTYRFGIDQTCRLLFQTDLINGIDSKVHELIPKNLVAKRCFSVDKSDGQNNLLISKMIQIIDISKLNDKEYPKFIQVAQLSNNFLGKIGVFIPELGYIPFTDEMTQIQIFKWHEYKKNLSLQGDQAAELLNDNFLQLKAITEVFLADSVKDIKISDKTIVSEFVLQQENAGTIIIDGQITDATVIPTINSDIVTILDVLKARVAGKKYLETKRGFLKLNTEFDWLQDNLQEDGQIKLSTVEFIKFHEQFGKESTVLGDKAVIDKLRDGLIARENLILPEIKNTNLNLRNYQQDGLKWLWWLYSNSLGGLLADEMGLGKTHQAMALISAVASLESEAYFLVVSPTTVMDHWYDKIQKFLPEIQAIYYHGKNRKMSLTQLKEQKSACVIITSYGILLRDNNLLKDFNWKVTILDEAHLVKNNCARTYQAACRLDSNMRLCLTGTPLENNLFELKNLFDYIVPNYLGSKSEFRKKYINTDGKNNNLISELELHRFIHPFKLRRNKKDVLHDLPEKVEDIRYCHLNTEQKKIYQEILELKGAKIISELKNKESKISFLHVFSLISLLKQLCNDPALIDKRYANIGSGKLELLDELLAEALSNDYKIVIFSQYAKMISQLEQHLTNKNIAHVSLTGKSKNRGSIVHKFQTDNKVKVFLGSLLAGGTGIDLTAANVVIHFDRWWNAAKEDQATDRIHRIGQLKNVQIYKLITRNTLEEKIDIIIAKKKLLFEKFIEHDEEIFKQLSREDLLYLLE